MRILNMKQLLLLLSLVFVFSCTVQKRKYQKGFYVNWHKSKSNPLQKAEPAIKHSMSNENPTEVVTVPAQPVTDMEASMNENAGPALTKKKSLPLISDDPCDDLVFKDGSEIKVKVVEITASDIKYKKCDMQEGPNYVVKKSEVFMIKYANGNREVFKEPAITNQNPPTNQYPSNQGRRETHNRAITAFVLGILSLIPFLTMPFFAVGAIINADKALRDIHAKPNVYKGETLAIIGKILGLVVAAVVVLAIALIIIALTL